MPQLLMMPLRSLVGGPLGLQGGIADAPGLNNIGLRARIVGKVTYAGTDTYYIDDGYGASDGSGHTGVRVRSLGSRVPSVDEHVRVDGIISCVKEGDIIQRLFLAQEVLGLQ